MRQYRLTSDGDPFEQHYWGLFIRGEFPSYEKFWQQFVVPLTNRPVNLHFKKDDELRTIGKTHHDVCVAQLHYSMLLHLARCYEIRMTRGINLDLFTEGIIRLVGCQDIAFELLQRLAKPTGYGAWSEDEGKRARAEWRKQNGHPLKHVRDYRNRLVHGRLLPAIWGSEDILLPQIGKEDDYLDWRRITDPEQDPGIDLSDFLPAKLILDQSWKDTVNYVETQWSKMPFSAS